MTLMIADDSQLIRERLALMLSEVDGVEIVGQASDGMEAIEQIRELQPDVVVLDIWMSKKNGIEVLEHVRRTDQSTVIIMFTNDDSLPHRQKCMAAGANYFLHKSNDFDQLLGILQQIQAPLTA